MKKLIEKVVTDKVIEDYPIETFVKEISYDFESELDFLDVTKESIENEYDVTFRDNEEYDKFVSLIKKELRERKDQELRDLYDEYDCREKIIDFIDDLLQSSYSYDHFSAEDVLDMILANGTN